MNTKPIAQFIEKPVSGEWGVEPTNGHSIGVIRNANFTNEGVMDLTDIVFREIPERKIKQKALRHGDIIIEKSGGSPTQPVGRVIYYDRPDGEFMFSNFTAALRPRVGVDSRFLYYMLWATHLFKKTSAYQNKTTGIANLQLERYINEVEIPCPSLPTQRHIATVLDKAQALVANDKRTLAMYDQLAQSLFLEMFGDPVRNERGWEVVEFADVVEAIENGWSPNCESYPRSSADEWAVLKLGSVTYRQFNANENKVLPDIEAARPDLEVQVGDLLVTRKNTKELVGAAAYVFETAPRLMIPDLIFRILTRANKVEKLFLWMLLNEDGFQKNVQQLASGSASSMPNISKAKLMALPIPLPPLKAQQKFAKAALLLRDRRTGIETSLRRSEDLFGSLLQRAFSGELV